MKTVSADTCILALDQGTTSSRAIVFDAAAQPIAAVQRELRQIYPQPGWVEHDPLEIWTSQLECAREALRAAGREAGAIAAIGLTNQRETTIVWERATGRPIANAIVWQDRRTTEACSQLKHAGHEPAIVERTGLVLDPYFSASKIAWLLDRVDGARRRAEHGELAFGTVDAWLLWNLTGGAVHATDVSNAARTSLLDLRTLDWCDEMLRLFRVPRAVLPAIVPSSGVAGSTLPQLFGRSLPIAGLAGDQQAATFGQACLRPGMAKNTYGTGCFMLMNVGELPRPSRSRLLSTVGWRLGHGAASYALEGSVFVAGALVQWLRDGLGLIAEAAKIEALAAEVPDSGGVRLVPAFVGLGSPHWDPTARGLMIGITRGTTRAHVARAALDAIALQSAELLDAMRADALAVSELRADGGAARNDLLLQLQADAIGVPVVRPKITETTALGAAYLAGLAVGTWRDAAQIDALWQPDRTFEPSIGADRREAQLADWRRAVERAKGWAEAS
ncbi:MAG TPA: glycerol kinase GlpK [Burkholderiaceae bacterium]|nr:glycerol kinase GlpK [Burkholderiaceae bacterium]